MHGLHTKQHVESYSHCFYMFWQYFGQFWAETKSVQDGRTSPFMYMQLYELCFRLSFNLF